MQKQFYAFPNRWKAMSLALVLALTGAGRITAVTRYVATNSTPLSPYTAWTNAAATIAQAYAACVSNDVIVVSNGVHVVQYLSITAEKPVVIRSMHGPETTFLDGNRAYLLTLNAGAVLDGFTVTNGYNTASSAGALLLYGAVVRNCIISGNASSTNGRGGALFIGNSSLISNCLFTGNSTVGQGGAVHVRAGSSNVICDSRFYGNASTNEGGAIYVFGSAAVECRNLLIYSNLCAASTGGGINGNTNTMLLNCTLTLNRSGNHGGGVYNAVGAYNTIIYGNVSPTYTAYTNWSSSANFTNCCIEYQRSPAILGENNFTNAPEFVDPAAGNFELADHSPCINTGVNQPWMIGVRDLGGHARLDQFTRQVDRGCLEFVFPGALFMLK